MDKFKEHILLIFIHLQHILICLLFLLKLFMAHMGNSFVLILCHILHKYFDIFHCSLRLTNQAIKDSLNQLLLLIMILDSYQLLSTFQLNYDSLLTNFGCPIQYFSILVQLDLFMQHFSPIFIHLLAQALMAFELLFYHFVK